MDYKRIEINSIGIGLLDIKNLDLIKDNFIKTYLAVGEIPFITTNNLDKKYNFLVTDKSVGINTSRNTLISNPDKSLMVMGNITCIGTLRAESIIVDDINLTNNLFNFNQILNRISSHLLFYNVKNYLENNIYTNYNVVIGTQDYANNNTNALKIARPCNNNFNNIQFAIQNNDITNDNEMSKINIGIIGNVNNSPAHIITSTGMSLQFNISKSTDEINNLYRDETDNINEYLLNTPNYNNSNKQYPSLTLDTNNSVLINLDKITNKIVYDKYTATLYGIIKTHQEEYPQLYINGSIYATTIVIYDYVSKTTKNIDSLYIRQGEAGGLTLNASQIIGGNFNKDEFIFNSNLYIGNVNNNYKLMVYGNTEITSNLKTKNINTDNIFINNNLEVNSGGICDFNNDCYFSGGAYFDTINSDNYITTKTLNITDKLIYNGNLLTYSNLGEITTSSEIINQTITNSLNVGGQTSGITDPSYNSEIINIYKFRDYQTNKFELFLKDTTITDHGSIAYIGHNNLETLNNEIDNSLIILTEYNTTWNNIYFYAGKNKSKLNKTIPNLAIMENNKIGINTKTPDKTLDIRGEIIANKYYIRDEILGNYECKLARIYDNYNNYENLNINIEKDAIINNAKQLNIKGGINSIDGYYENNNKLCSIKIINSNNGIIENTNIGIGVFLNNSNITIPLQIQNININNNKINNSVISFYRSKDNSKYSGIEFCDDTTNILSVNKNKWYIYKNHITDDRNYVGPLQFGYMKNTYKPTKSCINLYYTKGEKYYIDINNPKTYNSENEFINNKENIKLTGNVKIVGDLDIDGSINIKGNYKFNDNNILFSPNPVETIINKIYSLGNNIYYFDTIISSNHPKNISFSNSNIAKNLYDNINDDYLNLNLNLNITNSSNNYIIASNNYNLTSNNIIDTSILSNNYILCSNTYNNILSSYGNVTNPDINIIIKTANSNLILSSNIYYNNSSSYNSIALSNLNICSKIYNSISTPISSYLTNASNNNVISLNNYILTCNLNNDYNTFNITLSNIQNSNIYDKYAITLNNLMISNNDNNNSNYYYYHDNWNTIIAPSESNNIYINSSNNSNNSYNLYNISDDIYNILSNINISINNYSNIVLNYKNQANISNILSSNTYNTLSNLYINNNFVIDIANILITGNSNKIIANDIYNTTSNYYNNILNISNIIYNNLILSSNDLLATSNNYIDCSNLYINRESIDLSTLILNNKNNASNILINTSNINNNIINNYPIIYNNISSLSSLGLIYGTPIKANNNIIATQKILDAINGNISNYNIIASNNYLIASNLDNEISKFNLDNGETLDYYTNMEEIGGGITKIITFLELELGIFINNKNNIIILLNNYNFILNDNDVNDKYNKCLLDINYCINLLTELLSDANNLGNYINDDKEILLELILHITNKYINFINNSYNFTKSINELIDILNNYISIYITTSLSLIPLINKLIEYANNYLNEVWAIISRRIVDYASLSYSLNSLIGSMPSSTIVNNDIGNNTDVLIIGNNIKLYPNKSLLIGYTNDYSKWLETINDTSNSSAVYIYNYSCNSTVCSFNCRAQKFISTGGNLLSLKTSSGIDINLVDTSIKTYTDAMFDGVTLKLSHIYNRDNINDINASENNSLFEIVRKTNETKPYFSCYTTNDNNNILNIGGGIFYDDITYKCLDENVVVHINEATASHLLKLTNTSINPISIILSQNTINNWELLINEEFGFNYNTNNIFNITSNGIFINSLNNNNNASLYINSFNNNIALELKNNYYINSISSNIEIRNININDKLNITYNENGIIYEKKPDLDDYDISKITYDISSNINISNITYTLNNVIMNYNNISDGNPFTFYTSNNNNYVNLMPQIDMIDNNVIFTNNNSVIQTELLTVGITINYIIPDNVYEYSTNEEVIIGTQPYQILLTTIIKHREATQESDYGYLTIDYIANSYNIRNVIKYNKYMPFTVPTLDVTILNYTYNLSRPYNIIPKSIYKDPYNSSITYSNVNNNITITNNIDYLKSLDNNISLILNTYTEFKDKLYPLKIFNNNYYIQLLITINDKYYTIANNNTIDIEYINIAIKKPLIKQTNIYNNSHNIYSYTDDYEIYHNSNKLININSRGTLTTSGNIETNNIYLKGDIYNSEGLSLYDNVLSLINNISSTANFELNTKNIILNPGVKMRDSFKGGIIINGNNPNPINNNLFQINNFIDNDNILTLNSCTPNSYMHFISKIVIPNTYINANSIYRIGTNNEIFGIWKMTSNIQPYDNNYFIDTTNDNYMNALNITYRTDINNFEVNVKGILTQTSDRRLKTDIKRIDNALDKLCKLEGITYNSLGGDITKKQTGLIAQDVNEILPEAVSKNEEGYYNIAYGNLAGLIVEAIKELREEIKEIKKIYN